MVERNLNEENSSLSYNSIERIQRQERQYAYFSGDIDKLQEYLTSALKIMYKEDSIKTMLFSYYNFTQKVIKQLTVIYKRPARRFLSVDGKINKELSDLYTSLLPKNVTKKDKRAFRLAKLHNTALPYIYYDPISKRFEQETYSSWVYNIDSSDGRTLDYISFADYVKNDDGDNELRTFEFTRDSIYAHNSNGDIFTVGTLPAIENPFGIIPFVVFRIEDTEDFWGEGMELLVNANEEINFLLTKLNRDDIVMGTAGILMGVNMGEVQGQDGSTGVNRVSIGRDTILNVETGRDPNLPRPDLKYISTNPQIESVLKSIDWKMKATALSYGLNPNSFSVENKVESGFSRLVARFEQNEVREEDIDACNEYEQQRFDIIRRMYNTMIDMGVKDFAGKKKIPENAELLVDYQEVDIPATTTDMWHDRRMKLRYGQENFVDWFLKDNPDYDREEAERIVANNLEMYDKYISKFDDSQLTKTKGVQ